MTQKLKKIVLAYSGGLDTSIILHWLKETYHCPVVAFTADIGQGEETEPARKRAEQLGASAIIVEDLREEFAQQYIFPMLRANALYEGVYMLGTAIARPLIAKRQIAIAAATGADAVAHGATGKGNDQVRFELGYYALNPNISIVAPWREWTLNSRKSLLDYAKDHQIRLDTDSTHDDTPPYSMDANLLHISYEGKVLEDPWQKPDESMFRLTTNPLDAPNQAEIITLDYEKGDPVALNGEKMSPATLIERLNVLAGRHGVGRIDIVENRFVGMKSRGVYETPAGTVLLLAHRALESITLDRAAAHLKDELMPRYAEIIYNGFWFSPERAMLQAAIDQSQHNVTGTVRIKLYKGTASVEGRQAPHSLYDHALATFEADTIYQQKDAEGFIRLQALRLRILAAKKDHPS